MQRHHRLILRVLIEDTPVGDAIPLYRVIGSTYSLMTTGQGDKAD